MRSNGILILKERINQLQKKQEKMKRKKIDLALNLRINPKNNLIFRPLKMNKINLATAAMINTTALATSRSLQLKVENHNSSCITRL